MTDGIFPKYPVCSLNNVRDSHMSLGWHVIIVSTLVHC